MDVLGRGQAPRRTAPDTPVAVFAQVFPADTATLSQVWTFVHGSLGQASLTAAELHDVHAIIGQALTRMTDSTQAIHLALRVFPHSVEVDVLLSDAPVGTPASPARVTHGTRHINQRFKRRPPDPGA